MQIIAHRKNTITELLSTSTDFGVEIDIRSSGKDLIIHHDPFCEGESLKAWLSCYNHKTLILNVKEEGLEEDVLALIQRFGIQSYFFLDQSFPFIVKSIRNGIRQCAVRLSEYESIESVLSLRGLIEWVWLDCFSGQPPSSELIKTSQEAGFKVCLVSPELQGYEKSVIEIFKYEYWGKNIRPNAVCTKFPNLWQESHQT
jgi:hypothetical protein